jgi:phosphoserine phosphatase
MARTHPRINLGQTSAITELSDSVVADTSAGWLAGKNVAQAWRVLEDGSWIDGMAETFQVLAVAEVSLLLGTITWSFAAEMLRERYGFAAASGTEMQAPDGVLSGVVSRYFDEHDKLRFVEDWCTHVLDTEDLRDVLVLLARGDEQPVA